MRLINCSTKKFEEFFNEEIPAYAILSHTWEAHEVSYSKYYDDQARSLYPNATDKIAATIAEATRNRLNYVWIDSCCIDKSSSAELSEAINSMYQWYKNAKVCLVYLVDFDSTSSGVPQEPPKNTESPSALSPRGDALRHCRWFTRGFTLQELLAPSNVHFFDREWRFFGTKSSLSPGLSAITKIPEAALEGKMAEHTYSVAARMSWAACRVTTRGEDTAYCLFGIFGVNLPLLYGEGAKRAFLRLQEAIIQRSNDLTIFAWQHPEARYPEDTFKDRYRDFTEWRGFDKWPLEACSILAQSPRDFKDSGDIVCNDITDNPEYSVTNKGIRFNNWHFDRSGTNTDTFDFPLSCRRDGYAGEGSLHVTLTRLKDRTWYRRKTETFQSHKKFRRPIRQPGSNSYLWYFYITTCAHGEWGESQ